MDTTDLMVQLERLAQAFPWDGEVQLWTKRKSEGDISYIAYVSGDYSAGPNARQSICGYGQTPGEAVDEAIKDRNQQAPRDPEAQRQRAVREFQEKIDKLQAAVFPALPPYRPNRELCERNPELRSYHATTQAPIEV